MSAQELVYAWIRNHAPITVKMNVTREQSDKLIEAVATAVRDAERAAYKRAAKEISCACLDEPECRHPHACCREDVAAILALIGKETT
jgi:hypothetical protein